MKGGAAVDQHDQQWPRRLELGDGPGQEFGQGHSQQSGQGHSQGRERPTFDLPAGYGQDALPPVPQFPRYGRPRDEYGEYGGRDTFRDVADGSGASGPSGSSGRGSERAPVAEDEGDIPPWERSSVRMPRPPIVTEAQMPPEPEVSAEWVPAMERTFTGSNLEDFTGTGKISAIVPLRAGQALGPRGVRSPRSQGLTSTISVPLEDDQPSVQMRAMRKGNLARATLIVSTALLLSRILGLLRTSLFAAVFGIGKGAASYPADAYTYAFTIPDMIFTIVAGGALASAFIPVFTSYMVEKRDRDAAWRIASSALNFAIAAVTLFAVVAIIFTPQIVHLFFAELFQGVYCTPGVGCEGDIVINLTRIMLLQPIFLGGATIAVAVLQARQSFVLPSIAQVIYTLTLIIGIELAKYEAPKGGQPDISYAAWSVVVGAALQLVIQIPGLVRAKMRYRPTLDIFHPGIREIFRLMVPRLLNAVMLYVSVIINRALLPLVGAPGQGYGYVTAFSLILLPTGLFGMAVSQAAFPTLAAYVAGGQWDQLRSTVMRTFRGISFLALPSAMGMIALADPIARLILAHGNFDPNALPLVTGPLIMFATGLVGLSLVEILTRSFYAIQDTRTPTEVSILQFMFSIGLSIVLIQSMGANGLALASAIAWNGEALVLLILLAPRLDGINFRALGMFLLNVLAAAVVCGVVARGIYQLMLIPLPLGYASVTQTAYEVVRVVVAIIVGTLAFFTTAHFLRIDDTMPLKSILRRIVRR